jgi:hypothetical protein
MKGAAEGKVRVRTLARVGDPGEAVPGASRRSREAVLSRPKGVAALPQVLWLVVPDRADLRHWRGWYTSGTPPRVRSPRRG